MVMVMVRVMVRVRVVVSYIYIYILGFVFRVNPWISTHGSNVTLCSLNAYRDGKNMCVCSSWGQRRLLERQY